MVPDADWMAITFTSARQRSGRGTKPLKPEEGAEKEGEVFLRFIVQEWNQRGIGSLIGPAGVMPSLIGMEMKGKISRMTELFLYSAIVQGAIAASITFISAIGDQIGLYPVAVARVIAGGEAGMWFVMGYLTYLIVGVVATAVTSLFYFYIETVVGKVYTGGVRALAWMHLVLGNVGVAGACIMAMVGGYLGGAGMQPVSSGGQGWTTLQVHTHVLSYLEYPIAAFILTAVLGFALGGLGYVLAIRSK
jgi:hypothetical protein